MGTVYGGGGYAGLGPPRRVNFGWIGEAYSLFGRASGIWIGGVLLYGLLNALITLVFKQIFPNPNYVPAPNPFGNPYIYSLSINYGADSQLTPLGQILHLLFAWTYGAFQGASLYRMAVKQVRGETLTWSDLVGGGPYWVNMLLFNLIATLAVIAGVLALCVGLLVVGGLLLPGAAMVADGKSATEALSESITAMKNDWLTASLFVLVFFLLMIASVIPCGLGLFVTVPMLYIVAALAYRDMAGLPGESAPVGLGDGSYGTAQPGVWPPPPASGGMPPPTWGGPPHE